MSINLKLKKKKKCEQYGQEVVAVYVDRGISGKSITKRLELQKLMSDAPSNKFKEIWVWKTNRLARNHLDLLKIVDHFNTSTPTGELRMNVLASIGEFERETIVENVKLGMKQRARTGKWNGGQVLGYKKVSCEGNENKTTLAIVEEATTVRLIFQLYFEGKGLKSITNYVSTQGYRSKKGNFFSVVTIKKFS